MCCYQDQAAKQTVISDLIMLMQRQNPTSIQLLGLSIESIRYAEKHTNSNIFPQRIWSTHS